MKGYPHPPEVRDEAVRRMENGESPAQVAIDLGVARATAYQWRDDPAGEKNRTRKRERYSGTCVDCGARTDGSNGLVAAPKRCATCRELYEAALPGLERAIKKRSEMTVSRTSADEIVAAIRSVAAGRPKLGSATYATEARRRGLPSVPLIIQRIGSWNEAVRRAGLEPTRSVRSSYPHITPEDCANAIRRVADALGNMPSYRDYEAFRAIEDPTLPCGSMIRVRCNTWVEALQLASEQVAA